MYRLYRLDRRDHFAGVEIIEASDDDSALARAAALSRERNFAGYELWEFARLVGRSKTRHLDEAR